MSYFTESPFERMMFNRPKPIQKQPSPVKVEKGHICYGCERCGMYCVHPCCREVKADPGKVVLLCAL